MMQFGFKPLDLADQTLVYATYFDVCGENIPRRVLNEIRNLRDYLHYYEYEDIFDDYDPSLDLFANIITFVSSETLLLLNIIIDTQFDLFTDNREHSDLHRFDVIQVLDNALKFKGQ